MTSNLPHHVWLWHRMSRLCAAHLKKKKANWTFLAFTNIVSVTNIGLNLYKCCTIIANQQDVQNAVIKWSVRRSGAAMTRNDIQFLYDSSDLTVS